MWPGVRRYRRVQGCKTTNGDDSWLPSSRARSHTVPSHGRANILCCCALPGGSDRAVGRAYSLIFSPSTVLLFRWHGPRWDDAANQQLLIHTQTHTTSSGPGHAKKPGKVGTRIREFNIRKRTTRGDQKGPRKPKGVKGAGNMKVNKNTHIHPENHKYSRTVSRAAGARCNIAVRSGLGPTIQH